MNLVIINFLQFYCVSFIFLFSLLGYGNILTSILKIKKNIPNYRYSMQFLFGVFILMNLTLMLILITPLKFYVTLIIIFIGIILSLYYKNLNEEKYLLFLIIVSLVSSIFAFYSTDSDDFSYHLRTILFYKENIPFQNLINKIEDGQRVSYNSAWFSLTSLLSLKEIKFSFFCLTSTLYAIFIIELLKDVIKNCNNKEISFSIVYKFLSLIFTLTIFNKYKDFGSDVPGQLILFLIMIIFLDSFSKKNYCYQLFVSLIILFITSFVIKVTNFFIFPVLIYFLFKLKFKLQAILFSLVVLPVITLWLNHNLLISGCFIFPIPELCISNYEEAKYYNFIIKSFSKSVLKEYIPFETSEILVNNFGWIKYWLSDHFIRILEKISILIMILSIPFFISLFLRIYNFNVLIINSYNQIKQKDASIYIFFILTTFFQIIIWFLNFSDFRFGSFYIFNFIVIFLYPLWLFVYFFKFDYYKKSIQIIIILGVSYLIYTSFNKIIIYIERYGYDWPSFERCKNFDYINCPLMY